MKTRRFLLAFALGLTAPLLAADVSDSDSTGSKFNPATSSILSCGSVPSEFTIKDAIPGPLTILNSVPDPWDQFRAKLAHEAVSPNTNVAQFAIAALRQQGPAGFEAMLKVHADLIKSNTSPVTGVQKNNEEWLRLKTALDAIARQRDSCASKLYWFTDLEQAKALARESNKPILSLRLLGNLDDELSCANSRFFRTTLYANAQVSAYLRDHFILHWKSVRPVPKITIDFGDGRKLERTIAGNSIHYVLDSDGRLIDALPGLYGAQTFLAGLQHAEQIAYQCATSPASEREQVLREYHCARAAALESDWSRDLAIVRASPNSGPDLSSTHPTALLLASPSVNAAARATFTKGEIERPILRSVFPDQPTTHAQLEAATDDLTWASIAALHSDQARLDEASRALLMAKAPSALTAGRLTMSKILIENPVLRQLRNLERSISEDTVRNEYLFHTKIHEWLAAAPASLNLESFNSKIYAELFLTPDSDPWLGLVQPDICTALENNGLASNAR